MNGDEELDALIQRADLDGLVRLVDDRTASGDWDGLRVARDRCRVAVTTGRQLWPAATLAEYRLALVAPPEWAAPMIAEDAGLFTIGPLTEVIAEHHTWSALQSLLPATPGAAIVAHERVLRGESLEQSVSRPLAERFRPALRAGRLGAGLPARHVQRRRRRRTTSTGADLTIVAARAGPVDRTVR